MAKNRNIYGEMALGANGIYNSAQSTGSTNAQSCFPYELVERYRDIIHQMRYLEQITNGKVKPINPGEKAVTYILGALLGIGLFFGVTGLGLLITYVGGFLAGLVYIFVMPFIILAVFQHSMEKDAKEADLLLPYKEEYEALLKQKKWLEDWFWKNCKGLPQID